MVNAGLVLFGVAFVCAMLEAPGVATILIVCGVLVINQIP